MALDPSLPVVRGVRAALAAPGDTAHRLAAVLEAIGDTLGWLVGAAWVVREEERPPVLRAAAVWRARVHRHEGFVEASRAAAFGAGQGMPGRVWAAGRVHIVPDVHREPTFPRLSAAEHDSILAGLGVPLRAGDRVVGVMEFYSDALRPSVPALADVLEELGKEIGRVVTNTA